MNDEYIISYFYSNKGKIKRSKLKNIPKEIEKYLLNRYEYYESINEVLYRIKNKIEIRPTCKSCGKPVKFRGIKNREYDVYCSNECKYGECRLNEYKKTCINKYGCESSSQSLIIKEKIKQTNLKKYGSEYYLSSNDCKEKTKNTCINKYNVEYASQIPKRIIKLKNTLNNRTEEQKKNIIQKVKETKIKNNTVSSQPTIIKNNIIKFGVEHTFQRNDVKEKIKERMIEKYGVDNPWKADEVKEKIKERMIEKYGVDNPFKSDDVKEKIKETMIEKYGVDHYSKTNEWKQYMSIIASSSQFQEKRNETLRKNNTWNSSKDETYIYNELIKYFNDVKQQYSSNVYPFMADFYIPSLDLYIEYQGSDLHGFHPFTNSNEDKNELEKLKQKSEIVKQKTGKNKSRYDNRIYTWSDLDVRKRNIAKENNLNWIEFWNLNEFNNWLEKRRG